MTNEIKKHIEEIEKGCERGMQSGRTFCGNKHKKNYVLLCSNCRAKRQEVKEMIKLFDEEIDELEKGVTTKNNIHDWSKKEKEIYKNAFLDGLGQLKSNLK